MYRFASRGKRLSIRALTPFCRSTEIRAPPHRRPGSSAIKIVDPETDKEIDEVKIGLRSAIEARDVKALDAALAKAEAQKDFDESESKWYIEAKRIRDKIVMDAREAGKVTMTRDTTTTHSDTFA